MNRINSEKLLKLLEQGKSQKECALILGVSPPAVCRRLKRLLPPPKSLEDLTDKERKFVNHVVKGKSKTQAALASHDCSSLASAKSMGTQLVNKPAIKMAIQDLMEFEGLGRQYRIRRLKSHVDSRDPATSLRGLDISFKLDGYVEKHLHVVADIEQIDRELLDNDREIRRLEAELYGEVGESEFEEVGGEN